MMDRHDDISDGAIAAAFFLCELSDGTGGKLYAELLMLRLVLDRMEREDEEEAERRKMQYVQSIS